MSADLSPSRILRPWRIVLWSAIVGILLVPFAAMQLTDEMAWTTFDFAAAALLLGSVGLGFEIVARTKLQPRSRAMAGGAIAAAAIVLWAHGAVGVF